MADTETILSKDLPLPRTVGWDLKTGDLFLRPSDGEMWETLDTLPDRVKAKDSEGNISVLTYERIQNMGCIHTSLEEQNRIFEEILAIAKSMVSPRIRLEDFI
ncbi:hypothetical protein [Prochlorothrix hollandica]|uniref:hypothetical protein n=1 Tax=Prochlorothrix hollandica TaxID=1223 RepID=UPI000369CD3F|nr:hypothetical protein [Prochlorothrix hollandica]